MARTRKDTSPEEIVAPKRPRIRKAARAEKNVTSKKAKTEASASAGRPPSAETLELRKLIRKYTKKRISNPELAEKLGVDTMKSQNLCRPMVEAGELSKDKEGRVTFYQTA